MRAWSALTLLAAAAGLVPSAHASDEAKLRRLMVDSRFLSIISPCKTGGRNRNNAAEWLRTSFHDAISHDASTGTGGIDGSIQFEFDHVDNAGVTFPSTIQQYKFYQQEGVTLADMIVLGATVAVGSCGGPMVPFYHGRIDATSGAPEGSLPKAEQTTERHKEIFAKMGFSATEMIGLVACGHTLGGVHSSVHPELTSVAHDSFDDTLASFDNHIAVQHMDGSRSGPLGGAWDPTAPGRSSDTRIFASDGNATIRSYAESEATFQNACKDVFSKMFNNAVPLSVKLSGPIEPFPISGTLRLSLRNGVYSTSLAAFRVYDMVGQWSSLEITYMNRAGAVGDQSLMTFSAPRTQSIGKTIEIQDFRMTIPPEAGISSFVAKLTMNDGSIFTATDGEEVMPIDDTVIIDVGQAYTCKYSGEANNNAEGLNVTMVVLGPYNPADRAYVIVRKNSGEKVNIKADFRRARDGTYNFYGAFIPDMNAVDLMTFGAMVVKADGSVHMDTRDDVYYPTGTLSKCLAGAEVPTPGPTPSGALTRRVVTDPRKRLAEISCPSGYIICNERCINPMSDLEHCGGCAGAGGVDCTLEDDGVVACIAGRCISAEADE